MEHLIFLTKRNVYDANSTPSGGGISIWPFDEQGNYIFYVKKQQEHSKRFFLKISTHIQCDKYEAPVPKALWWRITYFYIYPLLIFIQKSLL